MRIYMRNGKTDGKAHGVAMVRAAAMPVVIIVLLDTSSVEARRECTELCARMRSGRLEVRAAGLKAEAAESRHRPVEGGSHSVRRYGDKSASYHAKHNAQHSSQAHVHGLPFSPTIWQTQSTSYHAKAYRTAQFASPCSLSSSALDRQSRLDVVANSGIQVTDKRTISSP